MLQLHQHTLLLVSEEAGALAKLIVGAETSKVFLLDRIVSIVNGLADEVEVTLWTVLSSSVAANDLWWLRTNFCLEPLDLGVDHQLLTDLQVSLAALDLTQ